MRQKIQILVFLSSLFLLLACASTPEVEPYPSTANPNTEISNLQAAVQAAKLEQVHMLAPKAFEKAEDNLEDAIEARKDGDSSEDILEELAVARAWLDQANQTAQKAQSSVGEIMNVRKAAVQAGALRFAKAELEEADEELEDHVSDFEDNEFEVSSKDRAKLLDLYLTAELAAIKNSNLNEAYSYMNEAKEEDAEDLAPRTLQLTERKIQSVEEFIAANKAKTHEISVQAGEATRAAMRLLTITRLAKVNTEKSAEDLAIALYNEEVRQRRLANQLDDARTDLSVTAVALTAAEEEREKLEGQTSQLQSDAKLRKQYEEASNRFSEDEAEVFLQGDHILVRLKGLQFESGEAQIPSDDQAILTKLEDTIRELGDVRIRVEGHTDSTGSKQINAELSEERAEAVADYLSNKGVIDTSKIQTLGLGFEKPITSNKTREGRAMNRRVDVIITPL